MKQYIVYLLTNKRHTVLYVGITSDMAGRLWQHKQKEAKGFTHKYNVDKLVYYEIFDEAEEAIKREKQIKKYRREKKETLIAKMNPEWNELSVE